MRFRGRGERLNRAPQAFVEWDGGVECADFRLDLVVSGAQFRRSHYCFEMPYDAHRVLERLGCAIEREQGVGVGARPRIGNDLVDPFLRRPEQLLNGRLDVLGSNPVEWNSKLKLE